jgi:hypothetical protein
MSSFHSKRRNTTGYCIASLWPAQDTRWIGRFITAPRDDLGGPDQGKFSAIQFVGLLGRGIDDLPSSGHMPIDRFRA